MFSRDIEEQGDTLLKPINQEHDIRVLKHVSVYAFVKYGSRTIDIRCLWEIHVLIVSESVL